MDKASTPIFILAGGLGTRIKEETEFRPKPMVPIGGQPIIMHIMRYYAKHGFRSFVVCSGFKSEIIKEYFFHYSALKSDFTVEIKHGKTVIHSVEHNDDWQVTVAYTGELTMTGGRIARATAKYLHDAEHFGVTYGDGLCNVDLSAEFEFHLKHSKIGTVLGVNPPSRFGELKLDGDLVREFAEKPEFSNDWINGGFFFFKRDFVKYLREDDSLILEREPLIQLARDGELMVYKHRGFWQCMDTQRDRELLEKLWASGEAPWL